MGLEVRRKAWQDVRDEHDGEFDAVVANGSLEHFASLDQARKGLQEAVYERFFDLCASVLDRASESARVVLTFIAFRRIPDPDDVDPPSKELALGSDAYHYRLLERTYRGWYPQGPEQVHRAAQERFELIHGEDGTRDYLMTTREWARRTRWGLVRRFPTLLPGLIRWLRHDPDAMERVRCFLHGLWGWQFEGDDPPCSLVRATYRLGA
jgi:cyclopropane fatty-acyl-phospholipid synthase-like methyltransferase